MFTCESNGDESKLSKIKKCSNSDSSWKLFRWNLVSIIGVYEHWSVCQKVNPIYFSIGIKFYLKVENLKVILRDERTLVLSAFETRSGQYFVQKSFLPENVLDTNLDPTENQWKKMFLSFERMKSYEILFWQEVFFLGESFKICSEFFSFLFENIITCKNNANKFQYSQCDFAEVTDNFGFIFTKGKCKHQPFIFGDMETTSFLII